MSLEMSYRIPGRPLRCSCTSVLTSLLLIGWAGLTHSLAGGQSTAKVALLRAEQVNTAKLLALQKEGFGSIALALNDINGAADALAARLVNGSGLELDYWIEIARNPALADAHPDWMASIQTHEDWRRLFPQFAKTSSNTVVKVYPWVSVLYRETFDPHLQRVTGLLRGLPPPAGCS